MDMKTRLLQDLKDAMRTRDSLRKDLLQILRAGILQAEKDGQCTLDDPDILDIVAREVKKRQENLAELAHSGRQDILDKNQAELAVPESYLPKPLTESEIDRIVLEAIRESGASSPRDMGQVMKLVMPQTKGRADGKLVNQAVKRHLSG
ncbi:MAG: GatB/YqeY domain-containing protein [Clostridiaceae bacterium]|nr:GatB/YqeY domain-containing protein [Clostridiaceae bacterium]